MRILIKSFVRQRLCLIKSVALFYIGVIAIILITWPYLSGVLSYISGFSDYYELVISFGLLLLLFRKVPMICIDEATLHYLDGTKKLKLIYIIKYIFSFLSYVIGAAVITYVLSSPFDVRLFILLALLMNLCNALNWKSYHEAISTGVCLLWYIIIAILFLMSLYEICIVASLISLVILLSTKNKLFLEKYKKDMRLCSKTMVAAVLHDQTMLANLSNEHMKEKHFVFQIKDKLLKYPLVAKSVVVDTLRRPAFYWVIKIFLFIVTAIFSNEINIKWLSVVIIPVLIGNLVASFIRDSAHEVNKLVLKQNVGLVIPYSDWYVAISYSVAPSVLCIITLIGACVFCKLNVMSGLCAIFLNLIINVLWHKMVVSYPEKCKLIDIIGYSACLGTFLL